VIIPELAGFELALLDLRRRLTTQSQTALSACVKKKHRRPALQGRRAKKEIATRLAMMRHWQGIQKFHDLPAMTSNVRYRKPVSSRRRRHRCCGKFERDPLAADGKRRVNSYYRLLLVSK